MSVKNTMQAIIQQTPGGIDTLQIGMTGIPAPGPSEILVKTRAFGINRADIVQREGRYPPPEGVTKILGLELAGEVVEIGNEVSRFQVGDHVFGLLPGGAYAEFATMDEEVAMEIPSNLNFISAASLAEVFMTAWLNLVEIGQLTAGSQVLIHAGASGVGSAAIQLVRLFEGKSIVTVGSDEKAEYTLMLGASETINYKTNPNFAEKVLSFTGGVGVNLILDPVNGSYLNENLRCMGMDGTLIIIGLMGGRRTDIDLSLILSKRLHVIGSTLRNQPLNVKSRLRLSFEDYLIPAFEKNQLKLPIDKTFDWKDIRAAHQYLESNQSMGKVVAVISD